MRCHGVASRRSCARRQPVSYATSTTHVEGVRWDGGANSYVSSAAVRLPGILAGVRALVGGVALQQRTNGSGFEAARMMSVHFLCKVLKDDPKDSMRMASSSLLTVGRQQDSGIQLSVDCVYSAGQQHDAAVYRTAVWHASNMVNGSLASAAAGMMAPAGISVAVLAEAFPGPAAMTFWTSKYLRTQPAKAESAVARVGKC